MKRMARLNEPPQPAAESIDALKRRFIRQNREIARVNSTQSVRIRNLECEVSRLLGENITLREEIIKLQYENEKNANRYVLEGVNTVKGKLEVTLLELGTLVGELGEVHRFTDIQRTRKRRSINRSSPKRSVDQRAPKSTLILSDASEGVDSRLPPILEDKYYPRKTMDAEELLGIAADLANVTDSPDLGPPPVAHFEHRDPIKFDSKQDDTSLQASIASIEEANPKLPANLETRKKRRESSHRRIGGIGGVGPNSSKGSSSKEAISVIQPLKSGAKRKLNVREEDNTSETTGGRDDNGMWSHRRSVALMENEVGDSKPMTHKLSKPVNDKASGAPSSNLNAGKEKPLDAHRAHTAHNRKALGPKSVNSDPMNSPLKHNRANSKDKIMAAKDDQAKTVRELNQPKEGRQAKVSRQPSEKEVALASTAPEKFVELPPETPIPSTDNIFSPSLSETSAPPAGSRDTPPPPDLGPDTSTGSFGRASRRPKGNVNYAQPNLRDKMRRPTAELVDAVAAEERARKASLAREARESSQAAVIKLEDATEGLPVWKTNEPKESHRSLEEPTSPLSTKIREPPKSSAPTTDTKRQTRTNLPVGDDDESHLAQAPSAAASAIAALTAGSYKSKRNEGEHPERLLLAEGKPHELVERPSIYDFAGSSPQESVNEVGSRDDGNAPKTSRSSRRHSTMLATSDQRKGTLSISRRGEKRRDSGLDGGQEQNPETGVAPVSARTKSVLELRDSGEGSSVGSRGERAASRRRSMML